MFRLGSTLYLDKIDKTYKRILTVNKIPNGPLGNIIKQVRQERLSEFEINSPQSKCCIYVIDSTTFNTCNDYKYMTIEDVDDLFEYIFENDYKIEETITKLTLKNKRINSNDDFICYLKYSP
tara:strand:- start:1029 stop:1394 length:366 start_codon:yes stop_codon:yes gene_type:complete